jgi:hypothetical protein
VPYRFSPSRLPWLLVAAWGLAVAVYFGVLSWSPVHDFFLRLATQPQVSDTFGSDWTGSSTAKAMAFVAFFLAPFALLLAYLILDLVVSVGAGLLGWLRLSEATLRLIAFVIVLGIAWLLAGYWVPHAQLIAGLLARSVLLASDALAPTAQ